MSRGLPSTTVLCVVLAACAAEHRAEPATKQVDIDSIRGRTAVATVQEVVGDGASGGPELQWPVDATRLPNGEIVVVDQLRPGLLLYDQHGKFVRTVGRRGEGPGELQTPVQVLRCANDSLYVWDAALQLMNVYDSMGVFDRSFDISSVPFRMECTPRGRIAVLDRPRILGRVSPSGRATRRYTGRLWVSDLEGREISVIGDVDVGEMRPLGRLTTIALAPDRVYVGTADSAAVDAYALPDGHALPTIAVPVSRRAATMRHYERYIDRRVGQAPTQAGREEGRAAMLRIPKPERLPYYDAVFSDPEGRLWVETSFLGDSTTDVQVMNRRGELLGSLKLHGEGSVMEVGNDYLLTMLEDSVTGDRRFVVYNVHIPDQTSGPK